MALIENGCCNECHELKFGIKIENFLDNGSKITFVNMKCTSCEIEWTHENVCPAGTIEEKENTGLFLNLPTQPPHAEFESLTCELHVVGKNGEKLKHTGPVKMVKKGLDYAVPKFLARSEIESDTDLYLSNGCLTIQGVIKAECRKQLLQQDASSRVSEMIKKIYEKNIHSDVILKSGSNEFKCHKVILAATSVYFEVMFRQDSEEKRECDLTNDFNGEELRVLLDYIYLNKRQFPNLGVASIQNLYRASKKYDVDGFREMCESLLIAELNSSNAFELLTFSMKFGAKRLRKAAAITIADVTD